MNDKDEQGERIDCSVRVNDECQPGERIVVDIEEMAHGPHAVARCGGLVVFVRGAAPGERVEVRIRERRRSHAFADVVRVESASAARRTPPCPLAGQCGGCPWQHLSYEAQLTAKRRNIADQLERIGAIDTEVLPVRPSPRVFGYRRRLKLRVEDGRLGFYAAASHDLVEVAHCALAESDVAAAMPALEGFAGDLSRYLRRLEIVARHDGGSGFVVVGEVEGAWNRLAAEIDAGEKCRAWLQATDACSGIVLRGKRWVRRWGDTRIVMSADDDHSISVEAGTFSQVNGEANRVLVEAVVGQIDPLAGAAVLDAYSGSGNFAAPLAVRGADVVAVEQSRAACESARANGKALGRLWRVLQGSVAPTLQSLARRGARFDAVVLDPPRSGAREAVPALLALAAPVLVYVSCNPATLARDLAALSATYRVRTVQPVDMFPHTYHVETVVRCEAG